MALTLLRFPFGLIQFLEHRPPKHTRWQGWFQRWTKNQCIEDFAKGQTCCFWFTLYFVQFLMRWLFHNFTEAVRRQNILTFKTHKCIFSPAHTCQLGISTYLAIIKYSKKTCWAWIKCHCLVGNWHNRPTQKTRHQYSSAFFIWVVTKRT